MRVDSLGEILSVVMVGSIVLIGLMSQAYWPERSYSPPSDCGGRIVRGASATGGASAAYTTSIRGPPRSESLPLPASSCSALMGAMFVGQQFLQN